MKRIIAAVLILLALAANASAATVTKTLLWDAVTDADLIGYRLYQSNVSGGPYTFKANIGKVTTTTVTITSTTPVTTYWVLTSLDAAGNESAYSNEASFLFSPDVTPAGVPQNFRVAP